MDVASEKRQKPPGRAGGPHSASSSSPALRPGRGSSGPRLPARPAPRAQGRGESSRPSLQGSILWQRSRVAGGGQPTRSRCRPSPPGSTWSSRRSGPGSAGTQGAGRDSEQPRARGGPAAVGAPAPPSPSPQPGPHPGSLGPSQPRSPEPPSRAAHHSHGPRATFRPGRPPCPASRPFAQLRPPPPGARRPGISHPLNPGTAATLTTRVAASTAPAPRALRGGTRGVGAEKRGWGSRGPPAGPRHWPGPPTLALHWAAPGHWGYRDSWPGPRLHLHPLGNGVSAQQPRAAICPRGGRGPRPRADHPP